MEQEHKDYADHDLPPPSRVGGCLIVAAACLLTFLGGIGTTVLIERSIPPEVPNPTEAHEGFGDFIMAVVRFVLGVAVSLVAAVVAGVIASSLLAARQTRRRSDPPAR